MDNADVGKLGYLDVVPLVTFDLYCDKRPLLVFKSKGHQVTYLHFCCHMNLIRASDIKFRPFCSICDGYRDKRRLPVFKVKRHRLPTYTFFAM